VSGSTEAIPVTPAVLNSEVAARTPVFLASDPGAAGTNARCFAPNLKPIDVPERVIRRERRRALWDASAALVREHLRDDERARVGLAVATSHAPARFRMKR
jgi:hypothetical protein